MRRGIASHPIFFLIGIAYLFVTVGSVAAEEAAARRSRLEIPERIYNFGTVLQGTIVKHDFIIKNVGSAELAIPNVVASCGCTATATSSTVVAPGQQATIHVEFDTSGITGEKLKTVRVYTNDLDEPSAVLSIKGTVEASVSVDPSRLFFGTVVRGSGPVAKEFAIRVSPDSKLSIAGVESFSPHVRIEELSTSEHEKRFKATLSPDAPIGELRDRAAAALKGERETSVSIPIFAKIEGPLHLESEVLAFGVLESKTPVRRSIKLENQSAQPIQVKEVRSNSPAVAVSSVMIRPGFIYSITAEVDPSRIEKDLRSTIEIYTDSSEQGVITLPVYGVLPPKL